MSNSANASLLLDVDIARAFGAFSEIGGAHDAPLDRYDAAAQRRFRAYLARGFGSGEENGNSDASSIFRARAIALAGAPAAPWSFSSCKSM
jgi:hypothetical protein